VSYILDALKKAAEQRGGSAAVLLRPAPTLARAVGGRRAPWIVVGIFLLLNAAGLAYLLRPAGPSVAPATVAKDRQVTGRPVKAIRDVGSTPASPPLRGVIEAKPPRKAERLTTSLAKPAAQPAAPTPDTRAPAVEPKPGLAAPIVPPPASAETAKLRLEVLSYSSVPAERLVFINGRRYREGDALESGAKIEEIREDGVVLSDQGRRFTLR
jgi:general secretion pathway protein B